MQVTILFFLNTYSAFPQTIAFFSVKDKHATFFLLPFFLLPRVLSFTPTPQMSERLRTEETGSSIPLLTEVVLEDHSVLPIFYKK